MTLDDKCVSILSGRLNDELRADYHYEAVRAWAALKNFNGAIKFFGDEAKQERKHARKLIDYVTGFNAAPKMYEVPKPMSFNSMGDVLQKSLQLETELLEAYCDDYHKLCEDGDYYTATFLQEFIKIQTESIQEYNDLINQYNNYGDLLVAQFDKDVLGA